MSSIMIPPSISFSAHGLEVKSPISKSEFFSALLFVKQAENATLFYLADLITYGKKNYGEEETALALEQSQFDLHRITQATRLQSIESALREQYALTSEHCYILAQHCPPDRRTEWAEQSFKNGLSAHELQKSIAANQIIRKKESAEKAGTGSGIPLLSSIIFHYNRWLHSIGKEKLENLPNDDIEKILTTLMPIVEACATLEQKLATK